MLATPKRSARNFGRVISNHRNQVCRYCCDPRKWNKRYGNHAIRTQPKYRDTEIGGF